jgi:ACS family hexuronate transporter-like MFS transporter
MSTIQPTPISGASSGRAVAAAQTLPLDPAIPAGPMTRFRWVILAMVFFATTINILDRMVMGILAPDLQRIYSIDNTHYGYIQSAFAMSYAAGQLVSGGILDRFGTRLVFAVALCGWSVASMAHALARGAWSFIVMRGVLGVSESPAFPASAKTVAEWFPRRERAFAFGFVNAGTNMGAILAPTLVPILAGKDAVHWQWAFIATGAAGFVWLLFWIPLYRKPEEHPRVSPAELAHIHSDPVEPITPVPWIRLLGYRQAWAFAVGKFLTDSMWWFYLTWVAKFLHDRHGIDLLHIGLPLVTVYLLSDVGSVAGGWLSSSMIRHGATVNRARKTALFICALAVVPIVFAQDVKGVWSAVLILGLATAGHQGFSSNLYTLVSDMFPKRAVGSVAGFGGCCGYGGASIFQIIVGYLVSSQNPNYLIPFICAGSAYLVAFALIHLLAPRLEPAIVDRGNEPRFEAISPK